MAGPDPERVVYHISPWRMWPPTIAFVGLGVLLLVSAATSAGREAYAFGVTALFIFLSAGILYWTLRFTRLEVSAAGVKLRQIGYTLEAGWDNVAALYDVAGAQGIVLHRPMSSSGASLLRGFRNLGAGAGVRFYNPEQVRLLSERRFIPIDAFAYWLKHGSLREELLKREVHPM